MDSRSGQRSDAQHSREQRRDRAAPAERPGERQAAADEAPNIACSRENLQLLFTNVDDMLKLVEVERMLTGAAQQACS